MREFIFFFTYGATECRRPGNPNYVDFMMTNRLTVFGSHPLDERPACPRDLYLTTSNTHERHTFLLLAGFEPTVPASEWLHSNN